LTNEVNALANKKAMGINNYPIDGKNLLNNAHH
jgi:hypothetical protein